MRLYSTATMIQQLAGLLDTDDLSAWEQEFVRKLDAVNRAGEVTSLTGPQVECLERLYAKHFA